MNRILNVEVSDAETSSAQAPQNFNSNPEASNKKEKYKTTNPRSKFRNMNS